MVGFSDKARLPIARALQCSPATKAAVRELSGRINLSNLMPLCLLLRLILAMMQKERANVSGKEVEGKRAARGSQ